MINAWFSCVYLSMSCVKGVLRQNGTFWGGYKCTIDPISRRTILRGYGSLSKYLLTADSVFPINVLMAQWLGLGLIFTRTRVRIQVSAYLSIYLYIYMYIYIYISISIVNLIPLLPFLWNENDLFKRSRVWCAWCASYAIGSHLLNLLPLATPSATHTQSACMFIGADARGLCADLTETPMASPGTAAPGPCLLTLFCAWQTAVPDALCPYTHHLTPSPWSLLLL